MIFFTKNIYINLFLLIAFYPLFGQEEQLGFCGTAPHDYTNTTPSSYLKAENLSLTMSNMGEPYENICVRVYPHIVNMDDGTGGRTEQEVWDMIAILNEGFAPAGISFVVPVDIGITILNETESFNQDFIAAPFTPPCGLEPCAFWNGNNDTEMFYPDGINIFILPELSYDDNDSANDQDFIGAFSTDVNPTQNGNDAIAVGGTYFYFDSPAEPWDWDFSLSPAMVHEMGHCFGLNHTFDVCTYIGSAFNDDCPEIPLYYFSQLDIPLQPKISFSEHLQKLNLDCIYQGDNDCEFPNDHWEENPIINNYMSYTTKNCMSFFSPDQISLMRHNLINSPDLSEFIIDGGCINTLPNTSIEQIEIDVCMNKLPLILSDYVSEASDWNGEGLGDGIEEDVFNTTEQGNYEITYNQGELTGNFSIRVRTVGEKADIDMFICSDQYGNSLDFLLTENDIPLDGYWEDITYTNLDELLINGIQQVRYIHRQEDACECVSTFFNLYFESEIQTIQAFQGDEYNIIESSQTVTFDPTIFNQSSIALQGQINIYGTLIIQDFALVLSGWSNIVVHGGGVLRVINSSITASCDNNVTALVEVIGSHSPIPSELSNIALNGTPNHGYLELNAAVIRNGYFGVGLGSEEYNANGIGVLNAFNNTMFIGNRVGIYFSSFEHDNISKIRNCEFDNNDDAHIILSRCGSINNNGIGLNINRSIFKNSSSNPNTIGILSYNSDAIIGSESNNLWGNTFKDLHRGIDMYGDGSTISTIHCYKNTFDNVRKSITMNMTALNIINDNKFINMPAGVEENDDDVYGIMAFEAFGFDISNNTFKSNASRFDETRGIVLVNTLFNNDTNIDAVINANVFANSGAYGFKDGIQFYGDNKNVQLRCNEFLSRNRGDWTFLGNAELSPQGKNPFGDPSYEGVQDAFNNAWFETDNNYADNYHVFIDSDNGGILAGTQIILHCDEFSEPDIYKINEPLSVNFLLSTGEGSGSFPCGDFDIIEGPPYYNPVPPNEENECVIKGDELRYLSSIRDFNTIKYRFECIGFEEEVWKDQIMVANYIVERDYESALSKLENIPNNTPQLVQFHTIFTAKILALQEEGSGKAPIIYNELEYIAGPSNPRVRKNEMAVLAECVLAMSNEISFKRSAIPNSNSKHRNDIDETRFLSMNIIPNPATQYFRIGENLKGQVKIYSATSNLVQEIEVLSNETIYLNYLSKGIYFVVLIDEIGQSYFTKMMVH